MRGGYKIILFHWISNMVNLRVFMDGLENETVLYSYKMNGEYRVHSHHLFSGVPN